MWKIRMADFPKMKQALVALEKIKDIQKQQEASNQRNFMLVGRQIIQLLYTDKTLNDATGTARTFASAFRNKLACCIDKQDIIMEWQLRQSLIPGKNCMVSFAIYFMPHMAPNGLPVVVITGIVTKTLLQT